MEIEELLKAPPTVERPAGKVSDFFKPLKEVAPRRQLKIGVWGDAETGKTHFCLTCPPPVYIIDTESGAAPLRAKFQDKEIYVFDVTSVNLQRFAMGDMKKAIDPIKSLEAVEDAINSLRDVREGTIAIDSITDIWEWCGEWMKMQVGQLGRQLQQFDWGIANRKYKEIIYTLVGLPVTLVVTAQPTEIYAGPTPTGIDRPGWQKKTKFWCDVVIRFEKRQVGTAPPMPAALQDITNPKQQQMAVKAWEQIKRDPRLTLGMQNVKYVGVIEKLRPDRQLNREVEDLTYDKLIEVLKPYLWWL